MTLIAQILPPVRNDRRVAQTGEKPQLERRSGINRRAVARPAGVCAIIGMLAVPGLAKAAPPQASPTAISGTYVGAAPSGAFLVQLASTAKGQVSGHYEQVQTLPDGSLQDANFTLSGVASNNTVAVVIQLANSNAAPISAVGTVENGVLHLAGGNGSGLALTLKRADDANFRTQVAALADQAHHLRSSPIQNAAYQPATYQTAVYHPAPPSAEPSMQPTVQPAAFHAPTASAAAASDTSASGTTGLVAHLDSLLRTQAAYVAKAEEQFDRFQQMEHEYHDITRRMRAGLTQENAMAGSGQGLIARSQINGAIRRTGYSSQQLHDKAKSDENEFDAQTARLARDTAAAAQVCEQSAAAATAAVADACARIHESATIFQKHADRLREAIDHIEATWLTEKLDGDALLAASDAARG